MKNRAKHEKNFYIIFYTLFYTEALISLAADGERRQPES